MCWVGMMVAGPLEAGWCDLVAAALVMELAGTVLAARALVVGGQAGEWDAQCLFQQQPAAAMAHLHTHHLTQQQVDSNLTKGIQLILSINHSHLNMPDMVVVEHCWRRGH